MTTLVNTCPVKQIQRRPGAPAANASTRLKPEKELLAMNSRDMDRYRVCRIRGGSSEEERKVLHKIYQTICNREAQKKRSDEYCRLVRERRVLVTENQKLQMQAKEHSASLDALLKASCNTRQIMDVLVARNAEYRQTIERWITHCALLQDVNIKQHNQLVQWDIRYQQTVAQEVGIAPVNANVLF